MIRRPPRSTLFPYTNALPICVVGPDALDELAVLVGHDEVALVRGRPRGVGLAGAAGARRRAQAGERLAGARSEEHTSELQSRQYLVCRLLLEKKKKTLHTSTT